MPIIKPDCRRHMARLAALSGLAVLLAGQSALAALPLFSGVTGLDTYADTKTAAQILSFQSDSPFQYQMQVVDKNHVVFHLYNARLASNVLNADGSVNVIATGAVSSAKSVSPSSATGTQDVIFTGPGLGLKAFKVLGATPVSSEKPIAVAHPAKKLPNRSLEKFAVRPVPAGQPVKLVGAAPTKKLPNLAVLQQQSFGLQKPASMVKAVALMALANPKSVERQVPKVDSSMPSPEIQAAPEVQAAPASVEMALPRYQRGARPIQAMTIDAKGNAVVIRPKNAPIQEFDLDARDGGYNVLFQAETPELDRQSQVDSLMNEALSLYHKQLYPQAAQQIRQALKLNDANADLYAALAEIELKQNHSDAGMQAYQQASQLDSSKYGQPYAQVLVQAGKRQEAVQVLERLNTQHPRQEQVVYMLGTLNEELGEVNQALSYLKEAVQLHPASTDIQYNLGLAYELSGDRLQAEKHYRAALTLSPKAADVAKALERVRQ